MDAAAGRRDNLRLRRPGQASVVARDTVDYPTFGEESGWVRRSRPNVARIEGGGTRNAAAFDAYLRGLKLARTATTREECRAPVDAFTEAIRLDSDFALAYASRSLIAWECAVHYSGDWIQPGIDAGVRTDAQRALALAPTLAEGYVALSALASGRLELAAADAACTRALAVAPNNDRALYECSRLAGWLGHADAGIAAARRDVALDPLNPRSHRALGDTLRAAHRYPEAIAAYQDSIAMDPEHSAEAYARRGLSYFLAGDLTQALIYLKTDPLMDPLRNEPRFQAVMREMKFPD